MHTYMKTSPPSPLASPSSWARRRKASTRSPRTRQQRQPTGGPPAVSESHRHQGDTSQAVTVLWRLRTSSHVASRCFATIPTSQKDPKRLYTIVEGSSTSLWKRHLEAEANHKGFLERNKLGSVRASSPTPTCERLNV